MGKFEITRRKNAEFQFNLKASNGQVILSSEGYVAKESCKKGIASVMKNSLNENRFEKLKSKNNKFYFNLRAANGQVIGTSEMYDTEASRDNGVASVKKNGFGAEIIDLSIQKK